MAAANGATRTEKQGVVAPRLLDATSVSAEQSNSQLVEICVESDGSAFRSGHLPGAIGFHWRTLLWDRRTRRARSAAAVRATLARAGVDASVPLIFYSERVQFAAYGCWVMSGLGDASDVAYADGGKRAWMASGGDLVAGGELLTDNVEQPEDPSEPGVGAPWAGSDEMLDPGPGTVVLDLRSGEEHRGEVASPVGSPVETVRSGRIPGARWLSHLAMLDDQGRLLPPDRLEAVLREAGATPDQRCLLYCRSGHRSALGWLAMGVKLGWSKVAVYEGAWLEWANLLGAPVERD